MSGGEGKSIEDCAIDCYVKATGLIKEDRTIKKDVAKKMYERNAFGDLAWKKVINDGVDKCEYEPQNSTIAALIKFYNCVNDILSENCVNFIHSFECLPTEELFEKCRNIQPNCNEWPPSYPHPEVCCKPPQLISENLRSKCRIECQRKEFFIVKQSECVNNCMFIETGLRVGGKVDFAVVKEMLAENTNKTEEWEKSIDIAVENCEKLLKGEKKTSIASLQLIVFGSRV